MPLPEPNTLYICLTYLSKDAGKSYYHWNFYVTGNQPPKGIKYHATDRGSQSNLYRYESVEVENPMLDKNIVVFLKMGSAIPHEKMDQALKTVPLGKTRELPTGENRWTCRVFLTEALKTLDRDRGNTFMLPPGMDVGEIEAACYKQANYYYNLKMQSTSPKDVEPVVISNTGWLLEINPLHWED